MTPPDTVHFGRWRLAIFALFLVNGFTMATWASRIPAVAAELDVRVGELGALITAIPLGAFIGLLVSSHLLHGLGEKRTAIAAQAVMTISVAGIGIVASTLGSIPLVAVALFFYGFGISTTNIVINLEAASVDRATGKTRMPMFHATWSIGAVAGAGVGALVARAHIPVGVHFSAVSAVVLALSLAAIPLFATIAHSDDDGPKPGFGERMRVWLEPRTLLIGLIVLAASLTEGTANSWLSLAMVNGRGWEPAGGAALLTVFTGSMMVARLVGGYFVDRFGRVAMLRFAFAGAGCGILLVALIDSPIAIIGGVVLWGLGASLGYPLGMSAVADEPRNAAARVSAVATVATISGLAGPSIIGGLGELMGLPLAFAVIAGLVLAGLLVAGAARPPAPARST